MQFVKNLKKGQTLNPQCDCELVTLVQFGNYMFDNYVHRVVFAYRNLLARFFGKNFVKATDLLNKTLKSWSDEISRFTTHCDVFTVTFLRKTSWKQRFYLRNLNRVRFTKYYVFQHFLTGNQFHEKISEILIQAAGNLD